MFICNDFCGLDFLRGLKGVVFDCDGVMFDTRALNMRFYNLILDRMGLPPMDKGQEDYVHAHAVRESIAHIAPEGRLDEALTVWKGIDYTELIPSMVPEDGLYELLGTLRAAGLKMGVFTNRTNTMELVLEKFGMAQFFDPVMTARIVAPKPHPEGMHRILEAWNIAPHEMAYIGDTELDAQVAGAVGVPFWAYGNESLQAQMYLRDFWSLRRRIVHAAREGGVLGTGCTRPHCEA